LTCDSKHTYIFFWPNNVVAIQTSIKVMVRKL
jgi:hypothetical protein